MENTGQSAILELDLLKTLIAVHETGNFSKAAEAVFRTPSAISMQVKRLEDLVGVPLFVRDSRTVTLTMDGEILLNHARRVLALNNDIVAKFQRPEISGEVRLGAVDNTAEQFLPAALRRFSQTHPGVSVDVTVENSKELSERFEAGQLDLALVTCDSSEYRGHKVETVFSEPLVWAGLKGGVAGEQTPLPISVWEEGCVWRKGALDGLAKESIDYRITFKSAHVAAQKAAIQADLVVAPIPLSLCSYPIIDVTQSLGLPKLDNYQIGLIADENPPGHVAAVMDHLRESFASYSTNVYSAAA